VRRPILVVLDDLRERYFGFMMMVSLGLENEIKSENGGSVTGFGYPVLQRLNK
jgi:hypothetical protein